LERGRRQIRASLFHGFIYGRPKSNKSTTQGKALVLQPNDWRALWKWATALCIQAQRSPTTEALSLYKLACAKLNQAVRLAPKPNFKTLYNAGNAELHFARLLDERVLDSDHEGKRQVTEALSRAIYHFEHALELQELNVNALTNLAVRQKKQKRKKKRKLRR
jgi:hypothetical protein